MATGCNTLVNYIDNFHVTSLPLSHCTRQHKIVKLCYFLSLQRQHMLQLLRDFRPIRAHNSISIGSAVFAQLTAERRYTVQRAACPPLKIASSHGGIWTPFNTRVLIGPIRAHNPNGISTGAAVFEQMATQCPYTLQCAALPPSKLPLPMTFVLQTL